MQLLDHVTDCSVTWQLQKHKHLVSCPMYYAAAGPRDGLSPYLTAAKIRDKLSLVLGSCWTMWRTVPVLDRCRNTWLAVPGTMQLLDYVTDCPGTYFSSRNTWLAVPSTTQLLDHATDCPWQLQKHMVSCSWNYAAAGSRDGLSRYLTAAETRGSLVSCPGYYEAAEPHAGLSTGFNIPSGPWAIPCALSRNT